MRTLREIWGRRQARRFLLAYLIYEDGVNTVIIFSSSLAATTFGFGQGALIGLYLVVRVTALLGAFALGRVQGGGATLATPPPARTS